MHISRGLYCTYAIADFFNIVNHLFMSGLASKLLLFEFGFHFFGQLFYQRKGFLGIFFLLLGKLFKMLLALLVEFIAVSFDFLLIAFEHLFTLQYFIHNGRQIFFESVCHLRKKNFSGPESLQEEP